MQVFLLICLLVACAMAVFCVLDLLYAPFKTVAEASFEQTFVVHAQNYADGYCDWSVTCADKTVLAPTRGKWATGDNSAASIAVRDAIKAELESQGVEFVGGDSVVGNKCKIEFDFPSIEATLVESEGAYLQRSVVLGASVDRVVNYEVSDVYFEYRTKGEDKIVSNVLARAVDGGYALPLDLTAGEYEIRLVALDRVNFEEVNSTALVYPTYRYSEWLECSVKQAVPDLGERVSINEVPYGTTLSQMGGYIRSALKNFSVQGKFVPSEKNKQKNIFSGVENLADVLLKVDDNSHEVIFDFLPDDKSYARAEIKVFIKIVPKVVRLSIKDSFSLAGEALNYPEYSLYTSSELVGGDTITDLGVYFTIMDGESEIDGNVAGNFKSVAHCTNKNYSIVGYSANTQFFEGGGRYWVYAPVECIADDNVLFNVYMSKDLMQRCTVKIFRSYMAKTLRVEDKVLVCAYIVAFYDGDCNEITLDEDVRVRWQQNPKGAKWVSAYDGGFCFVEADGQSGIVLAKDQDMIFFFKDVEQAKMPFGAWIGIGAGCVVALAIFGIVLKKLLRVHMLKKSYKTYVYQLETSEKTADCVIEQKKATTKKVEKSVDKKSRHGKNNKERNRADVGEKK